MDKIAFGIDISSKSFSVALATQGKDNKIHWSETKEFKNSAQGFDRFLQWVSNSGINASEAAFVMEATGVYYEKLAFTLWNKGLKVFVLQPSVVRNFIKFKGIYTKTDALDARLLARLILEEPQLRPWKPGKMIFRYLRSLIRARLRLARKKSELKNLIHAEKNSYLAADEVIAAYENVIATLDGEMKSLERQMLAIIESEPWLKEKLSYLMSINGVGFISAVTIIAETAGFEGFNNVKQLVSYAGLDVVINQSGNYKGKSRISKKGNKYIRHVLFNAALSFRKFSKTGEEYYQRLLERKQVKKMALVALERKLLTIMFALWRKEERFDDNYSRNCLDTPQNHTQSLFSAINLVATARLNSNANKTARL